MSDCSDHTSGNGNMFLVNGSPLEDVKVWSQTISVTPNTNYAFSTWIQALYSQNPAQLQFYINGNTIGNLITANLPNCTWSQYYTIWNSGNNTTATIAVVNKNTETIVWGNDFALDDISFAPVFIKRDSITITVEKPVITVRTDTTLCQGNSVQMDVSGDADHYQWSPAAGLSQTDGVNPIAMPFTSTAYIVTGTTLNGCEAKDTVNVTVNPAPIVNLTNNTLICPNSSIQLIAGGGESYQWRPSSTLSAYNVSNPVASPVTATTYFVKVTDGNNCSANDSVTINIRDYPVFTASGNASICEGESAKLSATGGHEYQWSPATGLNDEQSASPVASPTSTTQYSVYIKENNCDIDTTIQVRINVNPTPSINAYKSNDINCVVRTAQLTATGAVSYLWSPGVSLDYANRYNPIAGIDTTTLFTVKGTTEYGCTATDTIRVKVTAEGNPLFVLPNVFTPNGDRLNDCFGLAKWGRIQLQELSVYNRWGEKVFSTNNPAVCWDGTYKGILQTGTFVYKVKAKTFCGPIDRKGTVTIIR
ncbi:MAG: gliding motility-associated C-terminal domain-containing protein [Agriterribacter sp.]